MSSENGMDLSVFVKEALVKVSTGVRDAQDELIEGERPVALVNPTASHALYSDPRQVKFDIAVTVSEETKGAGGAKIQVLGLSIGGEGGVAKEAEMVSRIRFTVPVSFSHIPRRQFPSN